jgi:hypothetical protein
MDIALELLESAGDDDDALYFYRLALFHEDMHGEAFAEMAQTLGLNVALAKGLMRDWASSALREPLLFPATRWPLGSSPGGFAREPSWRSSGDSSAPRRRSRPQPSPRRLRASRCLWWSMCAWG